MTDRSPLTELECRVLDFENQRWRQRGGKESAIRDSFGMTPTQYYFRLSRAIEKPAAMERNPQLVSRLQRLVAVHLHLKSVGRV